MRKLNLPLFGQAVPGQGGNFAGILRGAAADGSQDMALILPDALDTKIESTEWGNYGEKIEGTDSYTDGRANTQAMAAAGNPLALQILAMRSEGHADLYLPSITELRLMQATVPELFAKDYYWSSTQLSAHTACCQGFGSGHSNWFYKGTAFRAVALRQIPLSHFNA